MLNAFQKKLDALVIDPDNRFEFQVSQRLGKKPSRGLIKDLQEFIRLLPLIEKRIFALYVRLPTTSKVKNAGSHFLTYMYQPDDFIPENARNGLFGYLDDAYLATLFYELMIEEIQDSRQTKIRREDVNLVKKVIGLRRKAQRVIQDEAIQIKQMLGELFEGDQTTYRALFGKKKPV